MALNDKNIIITPNIGSTSDPKIEFRGADASTGPSTITATVYPTNGGTLSFQATEGTLFSISNSLSSGSIFSVNPISGIPIIDVNANRTIALNPFGGNTGVGTANPSQKLHVQGNLRLTGALYDVNNLAGTNGQVLKSTGAGVTWVTGSGSGIDADLLDGLDSSQFLRSDTNDDAAGLYTFSNTSGSPKLAMTGHAGAANYNYFLNASNDTGIKAVHFVNGSTRSADNGANAYVIRNDGGPFVLGRTDQTTTIQGSTVTTPSQIVSTLANNAATGGGQIYLNGANGNRIDFVGGASAGVAAPTFTTRSVGTKIVLYPNIGASSADFAFGIDGSTLWSSVPTTSDQFKWFAGTSNVSILTGAGVFSVTGSFRAPQFIDSDNTAFYVDAGATSILSAITVSGNLSAWNTTTPGTGIGGLHLGYISATSNVGPAITFGARDASSGGNAQAGIYINSDGNYGTRMYFATTDSYAVGSKVAMSISESGAVSLTRGGLTASGIIQGTVFTSTRANDATTGGGQINLNGATGNRIDFNTNGTAAPSFTTRSVGTKIVLFPELGASNVDYAFGIEGGTLWSSVPLATNARQFRWYGGTTQLMDLKGSGELTIGSASLTGTANQKLQVTGGGYVSGNLGIGATNPGYKLQVGNQGGSPHIFVSGNFVSTAAADHSRIYFNDTNFGIGVGNWGTTNDDDLYLWAYNGTGRDIRFCTTTDGTQAVTNAAWTTNMIIKNSGNVGIATITPLQRLHVQGNLLVAAGSATGQHITQKPYELNGGTLSWEGSAGQLFSITNNLTSGSIFSVNDVSGIPSIDVDANGIIELAPYGGSVGVGTINPTSKLHVVGDTLVTGTVTASRFTSTVATGTAPFTVASTTLVTNLNADLLDGYNTSTAGNANTIALRDGSGHLSMNYGFASYLNSSDDVNTGTLTYLMGKFGDNYIRSATAAKVATFISGQTMNISGSSTSCSGNANTATTLQTTRTIWGQNFNGSANVTGALSSVTTITFTAEASDAASIGPTISSTQTAFDFNLADDNNNDLWRWRFTPSGSTVYNAMTLTPTANGVSNLAVAGTISGTQLSSSVATGTAPLTVTSTTLVSNLNSDLLDGLDESTFFRRATNVWNTSADGYGRIYFAVNGRTYYKSADGHEFRRNATDTSTFFISDSGNCSATGTLTGTQLQSTVATGTAPLTVNSTTAVANLTSTNLSGGTVAATTGIFSNYLRTLEQVRATGWYGNPTGSSYTGLAAEIGVSGGQGYLLCYNRDTSAYGILNIAGGSTNIALPATGTTISVTGTMSASADFRAPIFYDTNDTAYYSNQAGLSNYSALGFVGRQVWTTGATTQNGTLNLAHLLIASSGYRLFWDEDFSAGGTNSINVYNNLGGSAVTAARVGDSTAPNNSRAILRFTYNGGSNGTSPGFGGFYFANLTAANRTYISRFKAKLKSGSSFVYASNSIGTNGNTYWLTSNSGTGKWEEYAFVVMAGDTGTFSSTHYYYVSGGTFTNGEVLCELASATVYDVTDNFNFERNRIYAQTDIRAPLYYDSNDTNYYIDPASTSITNDFRASVFYQRDDTLSYWDNNDFVLRGGSPTITFRDTDNSTGYIHCNSNLLYILRGATDAGPSAWAQVGSQWPFIFNLSNNDATCGRDLYANGSVRSPIFYDSGDTSYYLDPASTTTSLQVAGAVEQGSNYAHPNIEWSNSGTVTGEVIFYLPGTTANYGMVHMVFDIYEYASPRLCTVIIGGHNWSTQWYNVACNVVGFTDKQIRLGVKDGRFCVVFGTTGSSWNYGQIRLRKIQNGLYYNNIMDLGGNWSTLLTTTESFSYISSDLRGLRTPASLEVDGIIYGYSDIRSPAFYDSVSTSYYADLAGTTNISRLWASYGNSTIGGYSWTDAAFTTNSIEIVNNNGTVTTSSPTLAFHRYGSGGPQFRLDPTGTSVLYLESANANSARSPSAPGGTYFASLNLTPSDANGIYINSNKVWHAGNDIPLVAALRANRSITGGGTIAVDASYYVSWNTRFIIISNGTGSNFSTSGYFDIYLPAVGTTITGVGAAASRTVTSAGILLNSWEALYYILPIGSTNTSITTNFRVAYFTSNVDIPSNWVLICIRNGDSNVVSFNNGINLRGGESLTSAQQDTANTANTLVRRDSSGNFTANNISADGAFRAKSSDSTQRFDIYYNEAADSLDFDYLTA